MALLSCFRSQKYASPLYPYITNGLLILLIINYLFKCYILQHAICSTYFSISIFLVSQFSSLISRFSSDVAGIGDFDVGGIAGEDVYPDIRTVGQYHTAVIGRQEVRIT